MIKLISFKICPFVQRVTALLEAKRIPYEIEFIKLSDKPQWFLDIAPSGQVPVLITETGVALFESDAIVEYIEEVSGVLEQNVPPEQRALDRAWSYLAAKHYLVQCSAMRSVSEEQLAEGAKKLGNVFEKAETAKSDGLYFKGDVISMVDIAWLPLLHRTAIIEQHTCYDFLANYPKLKAWQVALSNTGLFEKSTADDFEPLFTAFYLSENTYLGAGTTCDVPLDTQCASHCC